MDETILNFAEEFEGLPVCAGPSSTLLSAAPDPCFPVSMNQHGRRVVPSTPAGSLKTRMELERGCHSGLVKEMTT